MAALGDASTPGVNGLIQQFTAITGNENIFLMHLIYKIDRS